MYLVYVCNYQARDAYQQLLETKSGSAFKKTYGSCLVTLKDCLAKLEALSRQLCDDTSDESGTEDEDSKSPVLE